MIAKYPIKAGQSTGYLCVVPNNYDASRKYKTKIFIHGIGQIGDGTDASLDSLDMLISNPWYDWVGKLEEHEVILVAPQLLYTDGNWKNSYIDNALAFAAKNFSIDYTQLHLAGHSLAGQIVWGWPASSVDNGKKFTSITACCCIAVTAAYNNIKTPVRAYHAQNDGSVPYFNSEVAIKNINAGAPPIPAKLIQFGSGHDIVQDVFDDDATYAWMFSNKTPEVPIPSPAILQADASATATEVVGDTAILNGSRSRGYKTTPAGYKALDWEFLSGPSGQDVWNVFPNYNKNGEVKEIRNLKTGVYKFRLTATDAKGATSTDTVTIAVSAAPKIFIESPVPTNAKKVTVYEDKRIEFS